MENSPPIGPTAYEVVVPTGKLGVNPTRIANVNLDSPLVGISSVGKVLDRIIVPGIPPLEGSQTSALEIVNALGKDSRVQSRTLILSDYYSQHCW